MNQSNSHYILTASCPSRIGTVDVVTRFLCESGCYISELNSFDDELNRRFFIRVEFTKEGGVEFDEQAFKQGFEGRAKPFKMEWELTNKSYRPMVVIMVSKYDH